MQKAQQNVKLALNIVETIETNIKKELAKDSSLGRSGRSMDETLASLRVSSSGRFPSNENK